MGTHPWVSIRCPRCLRKIPLKKSVTTKCRYCGWESGKR